MKIFHLGHFEHSDFNCSQTILKKEGQKPLRGLFICEILKDLSKFPKLNLLCLEQNCDMTYFLVRQIKQHKIRENMMDIKYDYTPRNIE